MGGDAEPDERHGLERLEHLVDPGVRLARDAGGEILVPAWRRLTKGEARWPVTVGILAALVMQLALPARFAPHPRWLFPALGGLLLVALVAGNPRRIDRGSKLLRLASESLVGVLSLANAWSAARLIYALVEGNEGQTPRALLATGAAIWLTNIIVFSLWYWELDRGGPVARMQAERLYPDFLFAQMQDTALAPPEWEPLYVDYLYLSFTNAAAFSPTDVLPLSRWAKLTMMAQSSVSLATVALVIARAVNILK